MGDAMSKACAGVMAAWAMLLLLPANAQESAPATDTAVEPLALEWRASLILQGDALFYSDLPEERLKRTELRRARLGVQLLIDDETRLTASADFSNGARLRDLYVELRKSPQYWAIGRFPEPFGLAAQEGSRAGFMMETPMVSALGPGYGLGGAISLTGDEWGFSGGVFAAASQISDEDALKGAREENAITLRYTRSAWRSADRLLHMGIGFSQRKPAAETIRFVAIPESVLLRGLQVSSGVLPGEAADISYQLFGGELAYAQGTLLLQSEYIRAQLPDFGLGAASYKGYYVEGAWALTGEQRPYSTRRGVFGPITPGRHWGEGAHGAWELALRYSTVDFSANPFERIDEYLGQEYEDAFSAVFAGGTGQVVSIGLNWFPAPQTRVTLNGLHIEKERDGVKQNANAVQMRVYLQFDVKPQ